MEDLTACACIFVNYVEVTPTTITFSHYLCLGLIFQTCVYLFCVQETKPNCVIVGSPYLCSLFLNLDSKLIMHWNPHVQLLHFLARADRKPLACFA